MAKTTSDTETKKTTVIIEGKEYPCVPTLGANFDFKDMTGKEVTQIDPESITELLTYMWAVLKGACRRAGIAFPYETPRDLADVCGNEELEAWSAIMNAGAYKKK